MIRSLGLMCTLSALLGWGCGGATATRAHATPDGRVAPLAARTAIHSPTQTARSTTQALGPAIQPRVVFRLSTRDRIVTTPTELNDGDCVIGSADGVLYRIDVDGSLLRTTNTNAPIHSRALAVGPHDAIVANSAGDVMRVDSNGLVVWRRSLGTTIAADMIAGDSDTVYVSADGIYALDMDGNVHWHHVEATTVYSTPIRTARGDVVFATVDGRIVALDHSGAERWTTRVNAAVTTPLSRRDDGTLVATTALGQQHLLSEDGVLLSTHDAVVAPRAAIDRDGNRYFATRDQMVEAVRGDGTPLWRYSLGANVAGSVLLTSTGTLLVGADDGILYALR